jgi:hypothetical protein
MRAIRFAAGCNVVFAVQAPTPMHRQAPQQPIRAGNRTLEGARPHPDIRVVEPAISSSTTTVMW